MVITLKGCQEEIVEFLFNRRFLADEICRPWNKILESSTVVVGKIGYYEASYRYGAKKQREHKLAGVQKSARRTVLISEIVQRHALSETTDKSVVGGH